MVRTGRTRLAPGPILPVRVPACALKLLQPFPGVRDRALAIRPAAEDEKFAVIEEAKFAVRRIVAGAQLRVDDDRLLTDPPQAFADGRPARHYWPWGRPGSPVTTPLVAGRAAAGAAVPPEPL